MAEDGRNGQNRLSTSVQQSGLLRAVHRPTNFAMIVDGARPPCTKPTSWTTPKTIDSVDD